MYVFVGILLGSIITSQHDNREACEGRKTILAEKGVVGQCVKQITWSLTSDSIIELYTNQINQNRTCKFKNGYVVCH